MGGREVAKKTKLPFNDILMNGQTKNMMPYKNKSAALTTKMNGNTQTTINLPPVCLS
jgi:hypothetical protein